MIDQLILFLLWGLSMLGLSVIIQIILTSFKTLIPLNDAGRFSFLQMLLQLIMFVVTILNFSNLSLIIGIGLVLLQLVTWLIWYYFTRWTLQEQLYLALNMGKTNEAISVAQHGIEKGFETLLKDIEQIDLEKDKKNITDEEHHRNYEELKNGIIFVHETTIKSFAGIKELRENMDIISDSLPDSVKDISQRRINKNLESLEKRVDRIEDLNEIRKGIKLERWQVWLTIIALIIALIPVFTNIVTYILGIMNQS